MVWLCDRCDQEEILTTNVDGSDTRWLTTDTSFASARPSWSPDGKRIVAETSSGIAILDLAGKRLRIVNGRGTEPAWQPVPR
jgi:Tol biopolymer transport system component